MEVIVVAEDGQWSKELANAGTKLVVVDFTVSWCGPCKTIAPFFEELPSKFPEAVFLKVDVDACPGTAGDQGVTSMPTFIFYRNKIRIDRMQGANSVALEEKVTKHYGESGGSSDDCGVKGFMDLSLFLDKSKCECLNQDDDHPYTHALNDKEAGFLASDCDEQIILSVTFTQSVKVHSLRVKGPQDKGPKNIRIFQNHPTTLDFDKADSMIATQDIELTKEQLDGTPIPLRFVKFQNVQNIQLFIKDNQEGDDITQVDFLSIIGTPISTTNMNDFAKVPGKNEK
ncbi:thioredoxin-like protein 1 [Lepeophtheirus salmonis]|uniref:Thioredoxin-like protein 1 n=1 Tax=Lepeophtheirus salmonis TaxID=72036 RepID=C1BT65_LEPSM|nr:thioredoxin-like protein 1 [Lepeophtheirus salmonis]ACO12218.1 Thioredoxin-like protein 1 [Lepeophtheirus salmonis]